VFSPSSIRLYAASFVRRSQVAVSGSVENEKSRSK
jgi:hypothetical protein